MRIAIADPDTHLAETLAFAARRRGHSTIVVNSVDALFERLPFAPSLLIAGFAGDGEATVAQVQRLRAAFDGAGLFTAVERPREPFPSRLMAAGATAVIRVPCHPTEVLLQAEAWHQTQQQSVGASEGVLRIGDLEVALERYAATKNGVSLVLTRLELRLLYCLGEHAPHLTPTDRLLAFGWDALADPNPALLKTHISHLRSKLRAAGGTPIDITARQSLGYVLRVDEP